MFYYILLNKPTTLQSTEFLDELVTLLYQGTAEFPTTSQLKRVTQNTNYLTWLKSQISAYEELVPLYDISFNHIYLIYKDNVYPRIYYDNYRFITQAFYNDLLSLKKPTAIDQDNLRILSHYDLTVLVTTYMKLFYQSFILNEYITSCARPSFHSGMDHITPYYQINELYYLAYDWNLTTSTTLNELEINKLCQQISTYDIPAQTLLDHQMYIYDANAIGLVKHYSLFGSYYMNVYLRKYRCCLDNDCRDCIINQDLNLQIINMIKLIQHAPALKKSHTVYRFVERDTYLQHLKVGDIYQDPSFMSTTRNPFYYQENYNFGYILIKVKLPEKVRGVGLSIEAYSNFPTEEEIILSPTSRYQLNKVTELKEHDAILNKAVKRKYEFTWIDNDYLDNDVKLIMKTPYDPVIHNIKLMELLKDDTLKHCSMADRFKYFRDTYVDNINNQFISVINNIHYTFNIDAYDSTTVYKPFFYYETSDGVMLTSANPKYGNINILLELGREIHVNYYFRYSVTDSNQLLYLNRAEWIEWLSLLSYVIGSRLVVIHSNYVIQYNKADSIEVKQSKARYTYSQDVYQYLKHKKRLFTEFTEVSENFDYSQLDYLYGVKIEDVIKPTDRNELYRIYQTAQLTNLGDFYLYIVEQFPKLLTTLIDRLETIYPETNPFKNISYNLDSWMYLYNRGLVELIPSERDFNIRKGTYTKLIGEKKIRKFKNRLRQFIQTQ